MPETFYISDPSLLRHRCEWDSTHIEVPERLQRITDRLEASDLMEHCKTLTPRPASEEEILLVHSKAYYEKIKGTPEMSLEALEELSSQFEDIYLNQDSFECALKSAGCALELMEAVLKHKSSNGFAAIRPPGHHAGPNEGCGFCIFNNIAICAKKARSMGLERILIIDWDVHAGQGTQYCIEDDPGILLVSIHRYESGHFWPNLPESNLNSEYVRTINIPLQTTGLGDAEYASFIDVLIRPIIADYKPELILVSCGYDAAVGDREGEMRVTPAGYGHLTGTLASLGIPVVVLLEGGYFLDTLPEDAYHTLKALIEREPSKLPLGFPSLGSVDEELMKEILTIMEKNKKKFETIGVLVKQYEALTGKSVPSKKIEYTGERDFQLPFPTRGVYDAFSDLAKFQETLKNQLLPKYVNPKERQSLEIINENSGVSILCDGEVLITFIPSYEKSVRDEEVVFIYHFIYLPLTWQFKVNWQILKEALQNSEGLKIPKLEVPKTSKLINSLLLPS